MVSACSDDVFLETLTLVENLKLKNFNDVIAQYHMLPTTVVRLTQTESENTYLITISG